MPEATVTLVAVAVAVAGPTRWVGPALLAVQPLAPEQAAVTL